MGIEDNKAVVTRYFRAICEGRVDELEKVVSTDVKWTIVGLRDVTYKELHDTWKTWFATAPGPDAMKVAGMIAEGDRVAVEAAGNMILPDGRPYANKYHMLIEIKGGQIVTVREYMDTAYAAKLFGGPA